MKCFFLRLLIFIIMAVANKAAAIDHDFPKAGESLGQTLNDVNNTMGETASLVYAIKEYFEPSCDAKCVSEKELILYLRLIVAVENCMLQHAFSKNVNKNLPGECTKLVANLQLQDKYLKDQLIKDFLWIKSQYIPAKPMSVQKKILIGSVVIVAIGGGMFFAAPVIAPGTAIAAKSTAVATSIKGSVIGVAKYLAANLPEEIIVVSKAVADINLNNPEKATEAVLHKIKNLSLQQEIKAGFFVMVAANNFRKSLYLTRSEEIEQLKSRPSFVEQFKAAYPNNNYT